MIINQTHLVNINDENIHRKKRIKQRTMELETEIPIWYDGRVKWISNLTSRSTCSDVIQAILSSSLDCRSSTKNENYILYECWRGIERPLKSRCRLLKLWNSWAGECENVILTLRSREEQTIPTHIKLRQQENKLNKLKRQLKRTDRQIEKLNFFNKLNSNETNNNNTILTYLNMSRSIIHLNTEIENQQKLILCLTSNIENENVQQDFFEDDFKKLLFDVNQTLVSSRKLTHLSDQLDQEINKLNEDIDQKQTLLDELELDCALQENIDIDSLEDQDDHINPFKQISPSPPPPSLPIKALPVQSRPTAIVEPSPSTYKSKESFSKTKKSPISFNNLHIDETLSTKTKKLLLPFSIRYNYQFESTNNDESDTGISSIHSNDEPLITLV